MHPSSKQSFIFGDLAVKLKILYACVPDNIKFIIYDRNRCKKSPSLALRKHVIFSPYDNPRID